MITRYIAMNLHNRQTLYHVRLKNSDGSRLRCRVNGRCKTWKRNTTRFQLPVKYGMYKHFYIDERNGKDWTLEEGDSTND